MFAFFVCLVGEEGGQGFYIFVCSVFSACVCGCVSPNVFSVCEITPALVHARRRRRFFFTGKTWAKHGIIFFPPGMRSVFLIFFLEKIAGNNLFAFFFWGKIYSIIGGGGDGRVPDRPGRAAEGVGGTPRLPQAPQAAGAPSPLPLSTRNGFVVDSSTRGGRAPISSLFKTNGRRSPPSPNDFPPQKISWPRISETGFSPFLMGYCLLYLSRSSVGLCFPGELHSDRKSLPSLSLPLTFPTFSSSLPPPYSSFSTFSFLFFTNSSFFTFSFFNSIFFLIISKPCFPFSPNSFFPAVLFYPLDALLRRFSNPECRSPPPDAGGVQHVAADGGDGGVRPAGLRVPHPRPKED